MPEPAVIVVSLLFLTAFFDLTVFLIIRAVRSDKIRKLCKILGIFVLFETVIGCLLFSIVPTPSFCHIENPKTSLGGGCGMTSQGGVTCWSSPVQTFPSYKQCGNSVLRLSLWKDKTYHIEWDRVRYFGHPKKVE
jgi:hypothetical protein